MAGWHLRRIKMLFFSGAVFIILAILVHIAPYIPAVYDYTVYLSAADSRIRHSCTSLLHAIRWEEKSRHLNELPVNSSDVNISWSWPVTELTAKCGFQKLGQSDVSVLLNGSWIVVAGDSQARLFLLSLLNLLLGESETKNTKSDLFKRHSDYRTAIQENGAKVDFIWAPYATNLTAVLKRFEIEHSSPDVLIMSAGLWHMLHYSNASDYGVSLGLLRESVFSFLPISSEFERDDPVTRSVKVESPHMFWLGIPTLITAILNTAEKRERMGTEVRNAYDKEVSLSALLREAGGPFMLLDMKTLSRQCGMHCTGDGMHYDQVVYDAAVHIMLNVLLMGFHHRI